MLCVTQPFTRLLAFAMKPCCYGWLIYPTLPTCYNRKFVSRKATEVGNKRKKTLVLHFSTLKFEFFISLFLQNAFLASHFGHLSRVHSTIVRERKSTSFLSKKYESMFHNVS